VSSVAVGGSHTLALTEDGLVYSWGENEFGPPLGHPEVESDYLPKPIEALRGVRVGSIAAGRNHSYAVADTGELWAWGCAGALPPLGDREQEDCSLLEPVKWLKGIKTDAIADGYDHTLALADDGSVYTWGGENARKSGALGLGPAVTEPYRKAIYPLRVPGLHVACGL
jgi:alpha-tubulin suppressor-like RCC1 family protein